MCTVESSEIWTPPYAGQLTLVPVVSLLQRFHCTGQLTLVPVVSLLQRFHCTGQLTLVPVVSLLQRFQCTGQLTAYGPSGVLITEASLYLYKTLQLCITFIYELE